MRFRESFVQLRSYLGELRFCKVLAQPEDELKTDCRVPHEEAPDRNDTVWVFFLRDFFQASWLCFQRASPYIRGYSSPLTVVSKRFFERLFSLCLVWAIESLIIHSFIPS